MKINLALEWFLNPDHIPFIVGIKKGLYKEIGVELNIVVPNEHYDGFNALKNGEIEMALNEPLHLIEQFDDTMLSFGNFFNTSGGVMLSQTGKKKLLKGEKIKISSPVSNSVTNKIAIEILRRFAAKNEIVINPSTVIIEEVDFYHIKNIRNGFDGAWLVFENFEGVEARQLGLEYLLIDAQEADFPNFSALSIFSTKEFYRANKEIVDKFIAKTKEAIVQTRLDPQAARAYYYEFAGEEPTELMDSIIKSTVDKFDEFFASTALSQKELLEFFVSLGITKLDFNRFKTAFLEE